MDREHTEHTQEHGGIECTGCTACAVAAGEAVVTERAFPAARIVRWSAGLLLAAAGWIAPDGSLLSVVFSFAAYLLFGYRILIRAVQNLFRRAFLDEHVLMALATAAAFAIGAYAEAVAVTVFYQAGELLQERTAARARRSVEALATLRPDTVRLVDGNGILEVAPEDVLPGQRIRVHAGERIAVDARIVSGQSSVDRSALTGESLPADVVPGDEISGGAVNGSGVLTLEVLRPYADSFPARIVHMVKDAAARKARAETFLTRFARVYTPAMASLALLLAIGVPLLTGDLFRTWIYRACMLLVISCPCALVLSVPLGYFAGLGAAARRGILVKGGRYMDVLADADTVAFDKTGTLTRATLDVARLIPAEGGPLDPETFRTVLARVTAYSTHPSSRAVSSYIEENDTVGSAEVADVVEVAGRGLRAKTGGRPVLAGSRRFLAEEGVSGIPDRTDGSRHAEVLLAVDGRYAGKALLADEIRPDAKQALAELRHLGLRRQVLLTGDNMDAAAHVASELGIGEVHAQLLPDGKVQELDKLIKSHAGRGHVLFAGDGINDAPVLARADAGVAVGAGGSDAAIENADVVLLSDDLHLLGHAVRLARKTARIVRQNVFLSLGIKAAVVGLAALGLGGIWQAVIADTGVALLAVLNATRAARILIYSAFFSAAFCLRTNAPAASPAAAPSPTAVAI